MRRSKLNQRVTQAVVSQDPHRPAFSDPLVHPVPYGWRMRRSSWAVSDAIRDSLHLQGLGDQALLAWVMAMTVHLLTGRVPWYVYHLFQKVYLYIRKGILATLPCWGRQSVDPDACTLKAANAVHCETARLIGQCKWPINGIRVFPLSYRCWMHMIYCTAGQGYDILPVM